MDLRLRQLERETLLGDRDAKEQLCNLKNTLGIPYDVYLVVSHHYCYDDGDYSHTRKYLKVYKHLEDAQAAAKNANITALMSEDIYRDYDHIPAFYEKWGSRSALEFFKPHFSDEWDLHQRLLSLNVCSVWVDNHISYISLTDMTTEEFGLFVDLVASEKLTYRVAKVSSDEWEQSIRDDKVCSIEAFSREIQDIKHEIEELRQKGDELSISRAAGIEKYDLSFTKERLSHLKRIGLTNSDALAEIDIVDLFDPPIEDDLRLLEKPVKPKRSGVPVEIDRNSWDEAIEEGFAP